MHRLNILLIKPIVWMGERNDMFIITRGENKNRVGTSSLAINYQLS